MELIVSTDDDQIASTAVKNLIGSRFDKTGSMWAGKSDRIMELDTANDICIDQSNWLSMQQSRSGFARHELDCHTIRLPLDSSAKHRMRQDILAYTISREYWCSI